jgi:hypothetical protein
VRALAVARATLELERTARALARIAQTRVVAARRRSTIHRRHAAAVADVHADLVFIAKPAAAGDAARTRVPERDSRGPSRTVVDVLLSVAATLGAARAVTARRRRHANPDCGEFAVWAVIVGKFAEHPWRAFFEVVAHREHVRRRRAVGGRERPLVATQSDDEQDRGPHAIQHAGWTAWVVPANEG